MCVWPIRSVGVIQLSFLWLQWSLCQILKYQKMKGCLDVVIVSMMLLQLLDKAVQLQNFTYSQSLSHMYWPLIHAICNHYDSQLAAVDTSCLFTEVLCFLNCLNCWVKARHCCVGVWKKALSGIRQIPPSSKVESLIVQKSINMWIWVQIWIDKCNLPIQICIDLQICQIFHTLKIAIGGPMGIDQICISKLASLGLLRQLVTAAWRVVLFNGMTIHARPPNVTLSLQAHMHVHRNHATWVSAEKLIAHWLVHLRAHIHWQGLQISAWHNWLSQDLFTIMRAMHSLPCMLAALATWPSASKIPMSIPVA